MIEKIVSKSKALLRVGAVYIGVIVVVAFMAYVVIRLRVSYHNQFAVATVIAEVRVLKAQIQNDMRDVSNRLSDLERTVYGDLLFKELKAAPAPRPRGVELWQRERDATLRQRLSELEWWRYRMENEPPQ